MPKPRARGTSLGLSSRSAINRRGRAIERLEGRLLMSTSWLHPHAASGHWQPAPVQTAPLQTVSGTTTVAAPSAAAASAATPAPAAAAPAAAAPSTLPGDADLNGTVGLSDYSTVVRNFGLATGATWAQGDFDGDGAVTLADYTTVVRSFGNTSGTSGGSSSGTITPTQQQPPANIAWSGPLVITQGGTYTGNWQSTSAGTPAVEVRTTQPVTIVNANIQSRGNLIVSGVSHTNITVRNTHGWALNPNVSGRSPGRFLDAENFDNLDVENNTLVGTAGIEMGYYAGNGTAGQTVKILKNNALNIDGRWSNGSGGFLTGVDDNDLVQFAQFNACHNMTGVEIAWNQVVNQPGQSRVEDNISVFQSSGTVASPLLIHDNYIQGAYPVDAAGDNSFSGGGIMLADGWSSSVDTDTGNVQAYNNTVISTSNYGIAIASGRNNVAYNNTVISSALLPNGQKIASQNVGVYVWNQGDPNFANNQEYGNTIGWMGPSGSRNDSWTPDATGKTGDTHLSGGTISLATEQSYYNVWAQKVGASGYVIGAA